MQPLGQALQGVFVAGQGMTTHKDVEARVLPFDDDIQTGSHA